MARPCKSARVLTECSQTKAEIAFRKEQESILRGDSSQLEPPKYLTANQKDIFNKIAEHLSGSEILGSLDVWLLTECAICIDRLEYIEEQINGDPAALFDRAMLAAKEKYTKSFFRCCNELSLSPQSRAKMANLNLQNKSREEDPLRKALKELSGDGNA